MPVGKCSRCGEFKTIASVWNAKRRDIELICVDCVRPIPQPVIELMYSIYGEKWQYSDLVGQMRMIAEFSKAIKSIHSIAESAAVSVSGSKPPSDAPGPLTS